MEELKMKIGRQWLATKEDFSIDDYCIKIAAIKNNRCNRCGSSIYAQLPSKIKYCRSCIGIGRLTEADWLIRNMQQCVFPKHKTGGLTWTGKLTSMQQNISDNLIKNFMQGQNTLVHAVTGAGKTEMLFGVITQCLKLGKRACIATPRIDVVNELYTRFVTAFAEIEIGKYHGREHHQPALEQLQICTTHQLLKFYEAFDLLVIDEVDSFPYVENPVLHFAAKNAIKKSGVLIYLTATPTADLLIEVKRNKLALIQLKRRFHGGRLPVPKEKLFLKPFIQKQKINQKLLQAIIEVIKKGHPLLLFVPRVEQIPTYLKLLKQIPELKQIKIAGVHAADSKRLQKVAAFRKNELQLLITTTILERGVTFKHVWVIIVAADDPIYTTASLVQIAGRVGRAKEDPSGLVLYCYRRYTKNLRLAMQQIRKMNQ